MITAAGRQDLWNSFLHAPTAPPLTQREVVERIAATAGVPVPRTATIPMWALRSLARVHGGTRELTETAYMFTAPFVLDSRASEARLGLAPTPMDEGLAETVAWWREQEGAAA
jgi:nucleoside-diphosphate-sugar epimerase